MVGAGSGLQFLQAGLMTQSFGAYHRLLRPAGIDPRRRLRVRHRPDAAQLHRHAARLYGAFLVIALGSSLCGFFPVNVARWRARALSLMSIGLALGGVCIPLLAWSLQSFGWRATAFGSGVIALFYTVLTVSQIGGVGIGWLIGDRYDKRLIAAGCMLAHMAGLLLLTYAANAAMVIAFAVLHGAGWGLRGPFMQAIRADYFGRSAIGMILGLSFMIIVVGQIGGPMIAGILADATGDYRLGFTILALLAGLGSLFFVLAKRPRLPAAAAG